MKIKNEIILNIKNKIAIKNEIANQENGIIEDEIRSVRFMEQDGKSVAVVAPKKLNNKILIVDLTNCSDLKKQLENHD